MLYSKKYNFLYIASPKTGSTNFQAGLAPYSDLAQMRGRNHAGDSFSHLNCSQFFDLFPREVVGNPFTFSIMRDPFSRVVSAFNYRSRKELQNPKHLSAARSTANLTFDQFLTYLEKYESEAITQSRFLYRSEGVPLDVILRLEHIIDDIEKIEHLLPLAFDAKNCFSKKLNKSENTRMLASSLTREQKYRLELLLAKDLELYESISTRDVPKLEKLTPSDNESKKFINWLDTNRPHIAAENYFSHALRLRKENLQSLEMFEKSRSLNPAIAGVNGMIASIYRKLDDKNMWGQEAKKCAQMDYSDNISGYEGALWLFQQKKIHAAYRLITQVLDCSGGTPKDFILLAKITSNLTPDIIETTKIILTAAKEKYSDNNQFAQSLKNINSRFG
jgi:hypothetical protein